MAQKRKQDSSGNKSVKDLEHLLRQQSRRIEELERINEMHDRFGEFSRQERVVADQTIRAYEGVRSLAEMELMAAHDRIETLTVGEIKQRDAVLAAILSMNVRINSLQPVDDLLEHTLAEACRLFSASRGFIARYAGATMSPIVRSGFLHESDADTILEAILAGRTVVGLHAKLTREGRIIGLVYIERNKDKGGFSEVDREFLEILASQLSVGFNNSLLYNRLRQQNRELRRMIMLRSNFIEHLSADLQRPLGKLVEMLSGEDTSRYQEASSLADWLHKAVNKVISVVALQQEVDEMYLHSIHMDDLIREIVQSLQDEIGKRQLTVEYDFPDEIKVFDGNRDIIHTIMDEVICNAIVYNKPKGNLRIVIEQDSQFCHVTVVDSGIGICKDDLGKIFERFYRAGSSPGLYNRGAGLGLYIVRNFIEAYGGSISLSSVLDKGTEVSLLFPM